jgi:alkanesulfonate monooxygenase SsuD/methylene tetrahydromethanopterin reductase-like flavin-dependent oxidoreductase (luciferase family)
MELSWLRLRTGRPAPLASPEEALAYPYTPLEREAVQAARRHFLAGDPVSVQKQLERWVALTGADEIMVTTMVYDPQARLRSYELLAEAFGLNPGESTRRWVTQKQAAEPEPPVS